MGASVLPLAIKGKLTNLDNMLPLHMDADDYRLHQCDKAGQDHQSHAITNKTNNNNFNFYL